MFGRAMPWLEDQAELFAWTAFSPPNLTLFARPDMFHAIFSYPLAPDRTRVTALTLYPAEWLEEPAFEEKAKVNAEFFKMVLEEDNDMLRSLQNGVGSRHFDPGPTVKPEEGVHQLLNRYLDRMFGEGSTKAL